LVFIALIFSDLLHFVPLQVLSPAKLWRKLSDEKAIGGKTVE
jgi:hypothetical protein